MMNRTWLFAMGLLLLSTACTWGITLPGQPTQPAGVEPTSPALPVESAPAPALATATSAALKPTRSPTPTRVPVPTLTPSFTPTKVLPTLAAGKTILIEYFDKLGGEAPFVPSDAYIGRNLPRLVIYTDEQIIWRDDAGALWESTMPEKAICTLIGGMQKFGFFQVKGDGSLEAKDPIYKDIPKEYLDMTGLTSFLLVVNGNPSKRVIIYRPFVDSLVQPVKSTWEVFNGFKPGDLQPYEPELYVLWIEAGQKLARKYGAGKDLEPANWPKQLPQLSKLLGDQEAVQLPMDPEEADPLLQYYNPAPGVKLFEQGQNRYSVILRPLLPHEELDNLSPVPQAVRQFALPFKCPK